MTSVEFEKLPPALGESAAASRARLLTIAYAATLFLSAFLLFSVQPMFTKMVLPVLGGSPGVWSVAMVFFQALLLGGYLWAHLLTRYLSLRTAALAHLGLTLLALAALPVALGVNGLAPPEHSQALWLIGVFGAAVGLPFFALSANGPLLQAWFARSGHPRASDPYTLYGASNIGSFGALLAYPFAVEPLIGLAGQSSLWSWGYGSLIGCLGICGYLALRGAKSGAITAAAAPVSRPSGWTWAEFAGWTALAAVPSGLLVSVTAHISTDIASAPLLWVLPLALYLLTFVAAFRERFPLREAWLAPVQIFATLAMLAFMAIGGTSLMVTLALHLAFFFVSVLICHRALYGLRPGHADLTVFYLAMSLGGVIGGLLAGLVAPNIFSSVYEYPLLITAGLLCQPQVVAALRRFTWRSNWYEIAIPAAIVAGCWFAADTLLPAGRAIMLCSALLFCAGVMRWRSFAQASYCAIALSIVAIWLPQSLSKAQTWRSFFGVHKVREIDHMGGRFRVLIHGTTMHGAVRIDSGGAPTPADRPLPTTYYASEGPIAQAMDSVRTRQGRLALIHAVGLGVGTLACQRRAGEEIVYFEIDPEVIRLARDAKLFNFLSACAPDARIVLGDARLTLARESKPANVVIVDAFSSDAIPVHLLTREALAVYLSKLTADGVIVVHISNKVMNLTQTVARVAAEFGLAAYRRVDLMPDSPGGMDADMRSASMAMVLARDPAHLGTIAQSWTPVQPDMARRPWTDDFSTILEPIRDRGR